jgi:predicted nucleic acid-binding Zn ribbon protein
MPIRKEDVEKHHGDTQSLSEALNEFTKVFKLNRGLNQAAIVNDWRDFMGDTVADKTTSVKIFNKVLTIKVSSAPLKAQLIMMKSDIVKKVNERFGPDALTDIIFK